MLLIAINLTLIEILVLLMGATVLGFAIYFFMASRRFLQQYLPQPRKTAAATSTPPTASSPTAPAATKEKGGKEKKDPKYFDDRVQHYKQNGWTVYGAEPKKEVSKDEMIDTLRNTITQQQKTLNGFLMEIEGLPLKRRLPATGLLRRRLNLYFDFVVV